MGAAQRSAFSQPAPTFRATCGELRQKLATLTDDDSVLTTIQVLAPLTGVTSDGALAYLTLCAAPAPQVLCVTYQTNGRTPGEVVVASGALSRRGSDHVLLDPCLHTAPDEGQQGQ